MSESNNKSGARKSKSKIAFFIVMAIAEVFVLGVIFVYAYALKQYSKIQRPEYDVEEVINTDLSEQKLEEMRGYWNIAVFGVDSRDSSVGKGNRSDVIIIASIDQSSGEIKLVSVYRDSYLNVGNNSYQKCNAAYSYGGPARAVKMLNDNLDLNISDYITFNWKAVATAINILGGVDVEITKSEFRYINSYITETVKGTGIGSVQLKKPGMHHLDGVQAVAYARLRYMDTDYQRTERQRKIIQLAFDKVKKADLKTLNDLLGNMLSMVATNLTWQDGLDAINNINKYKLTETSGFPFTMEDMRLGTKGFIVVPTNLESNVLELHKFLFADEDYSVSQKVKQYGAKISSDTGYYKEGDKVRHVKPDNDYKSDSDDDTTKRSKKSATEEESTTKKKVDIFMDNNGKYYQLDSDGETIWLDEEEGEEYYTDGAGNKYYLIPDSESNSRESASGTETKGTVNIGPGETATSKGTNAETPAGSSETVAKPGIGPGETSKSPTAAGEPSSTEAPKGPGAETSDTAKETTAVREPGPSVQPSTAAPSSAGPGSANVPSVEAKPE